MSQNREYKKVLICAPTNITLTGFVRDAFVTCGAEVSIFDAVLSANSLIKNAFIKTLAIKWLNIVFKRLFVFNVNKGFLRLIRRENYDLIFIYNSEYLNVGSIDKAKEKGVILVNYLGDNPFYTNIYDEGIECLSRFDIILSPDKFWLVCLSSLDLQGRGMFALPGANPEFKILSCTRKDKAVFVGSNYVGKEGYKRASLLAQCGTKIDIYGGNSWRRWLTKFPSIADSYMYSERLSDSRLNELINSYKLAIVDANTGIVAGVHQRLLDISQTGCLALVEYRQGIEEIIGDFDVVFKSTMHLMSLIDYYLQNEDKRVETQTAMREFIRQQYSAQTFMSCLE